MANNNNSNGGGRDLRRDLRSLRHQLLFMLVIMPAAWLLLECFTPWRLNSFWVTVYISGVVLLTAAAYKIALWRNGAK